MGLRERPYTSKPSEALKARLSEAENARLFVVGTPGPTSFVLKAAAEEGERRKTLKVSIGSVHSCTCGAREQPCVHVAFVMLRVFRLAPSDPRCWQASLIDSELEALVDSRAAARRRLESSSARQWGSAAADGGADGSSDGGDPRDVRRRALEGEEGDPCPICYEEIDPAEDEAGELDWCRRSCGKSVHRRCFAMWADHQSSTSKKLTCPHCRGDWASTPAPPPPKVSEATARAGARGGVAADSTRAAPRPPTHRGVRCRSCRTTPIVGPRFRCLVCPPSVDLCSECFTSCMHPHHPFGLKERSSAAWCAAPCRAVSTGEGGGGEDGGGEGGGGEGGGGHVMLQRASAGGGAAAAQLIAELQHREILPEDYDLLLALSDTSVTAALPAAARAMGRGSGGGGTTGGHGGGGRQGGGGGPGGGSVQSHSSVGDVSNSSRLVHYDAEGVAPLIDELNEIEAEAKRAAAAAAAAAAAPSDAAPPMPLLSGQSISIGLRAAGGELPAIRAGRGCVAPPSAAFSSGVARPWHQQRQTASLAADRLAAEVRRRLYSHSSPRMRRGSHARASRGSRLRAYVLTHFLTSSLAGWLAGWLACLTRLLTLADSRTPAAPRWCVRSAWRRALASALRIWGSAATPSRQACGAAAVAAAVAAAAAVAGKAAVCKEAVGRLGAVPSFAAVQVRRRPLDARTLLVGHSRLAGNSLWVA